MKIICLGDSITWGFPFGPQESWVEMLQRKLQVEIINRGINGNTTSDMLQRFDRHVLQAEPTHLILMGGINDVVGQEPYDVIVRNLQIMIDKALDAGIIVIIGTPTAVDYAPWERGLIRLRDWIHQRADQLQLEVINFHQAFYDSEGQLLTELLLPDGGHPARSGYKAMFEQIDLSIFVSSN